MSLGEKIAGAIPDSAIEYVHEHPRVVYAVTIPLMAYCAWVFLRSVRLHAAAEQFVAGRVSGLPRAASEALGG